MQTRIGVGALALAAFAITGAAAFAQDTYKLYRCPRDRPYCTVESHAVLSPAEAARAEAMARGEIVTYDPAAEAEKAKRRNASGYVGPAATSLCAPPHRMTSDGCK